jgi:hypothetical protein
VTTAAATASAPSQDILTIIATDQVVVPAVEPVAENKQETEAHSDLVQLLDGDVIARPAK